MKAHDPASPDYLVEIVVTNPDGRIVKRRRSGTDRVNTDVVLDAVRYATQTLRGDAPLVETDRGYVFDRDGVFDVRVNVYTLLTP